MTRPGGETIKEKRMLTDIRLDGPNSARYNFFNPLVLPGLCLIGVFFLLLLAIAIINPFNRWLDRSRWHWLVLWVPLGLGFIPFYFVGQTPRPTAQQVVTAIEKNYGVTYLEASPTTARPTYGGRRNSSPIARSYPYRVRVNANGHVLSNCVTVPTSLSFKTYLTFEVLCGGKDITDQEGVMNPK